MLVKGAPDNSCCTRVYVLGNSLALEQSHGFPSARELILKNKAKLISTRPLRNETDAEYIYMSWNMLSIGP